MNLVLTKVIEDSINKIKQRLIKVLVRGKDDIQTPILVSPFGSDASPMKDMVAVYARTENDGSIICLGYLNRHSLAGVGEHRIYSLKDADNVATYVWLKANGIIELGGDTNYAVKYNELKAEYDKTKNYLTTLKTATGAVATALDSLVPGTSAAFNAAMASQVVGDFSQTKNAKIKTVG